MQRTNNDDNLERTGAEYADKTRPVQNNRPKFVMKREDAPIIGDASKHLSARAARIRAAKQAYALRQKEIHESNLPPLAPISTSIPTSPFRESKPSTPLNSFRRQRLRNRGALLVSSTLSPTDTFHHPASSPRLNSSWIKRDSSSDKPTEFSTISSNLLPAVASSLSYPKPDSALESEVSNSPKTILDSTCYTKSPSTTKQAIKDEAAFLSPVDKHPATYSFLSTMKAFEQNAKISNTFKPNLASDIVQNTVQDAFHFEETFKTPVKSIQTQDALDINVCQDQNAPEIEAPIDMSDEKSTFSHTSCSSEQEDETAYNDVSYDDSTDEEDEEFLQRPFLSEGEVAFPRVDDYKLKKKSLKKAENSKPKIPSKFEDMDAKTDGSTSHPPTLEPYICKLERFELFSTHQAYYLVACDKQNSQYRVLRMDRTRIESSSSSPIAEPVTTQPTTVQPTLTDEADASLKGGITSPSLSSPQTMPPKGTAQPGTATPAGTPQVGQGHNSLQMPLAKFCQEDPHVYSQNEIQDMLDMIHHGNQSVGGLHPVTKAYGIVGLFRFLDCYYLTLITKRTKVGNIGGHGIYTIKQTETYPLKASIMLTGSRSPYDDIPNGLPGLGSSGAVVGVRPNKSHIVPTSLTNTQDPSSMLLNMWNRGKRSVGLGLSPREIAELRYQGLYQVVDLTKNFYFSYTYDMTRSLQENMLLYRSRPFPPPPCKEMYSWNWYLSHELGDLASWQWQLPIIHGAYVQSQLHDYGRVLHLILLARRSRHFAGTRYLKRGVSDCGMVANDVEHEQILQDDSCGINKDRLDPKEGLASLGHPGIFSSFLQMRGSIPVYWTQESSVTMPKPPIVLNRVDPTYQASQAHFEHLFQRYGSPLIVLDLVRQSEKREREVIVGNEYRHAVDYINTNCMTHVNPVHQIRYCALDYSHISKHRNLNISTSLNEVATWAVNQTGFFCSAPKWKIDKNGDIVPFIPSEDAREAKWWSNTLEIGVFDMEQKGVLRTNCIDCLDRTNVAQFSAGVMALAQQLCVMGIRSSTHLDPSSNIVRVLIDMYVEVGDHVALQYGGSEAHKKGPTAGAGAPGGSSSDPTTGSMGKHKELLTSIRRYYSNAFTDRLKQDAMNLFLGYYIPSQHATPLWDLENDYYLHNFHVRGGGDLLRTMKAHERSFGFDWEKSNLEHDEMYLTKDTTHKVLYRCQSHSDNLSARWRAAVQSYVQQRMWMQLSRGSSDVVLPPRFERLYQPEKLTQFDKFFSRAWANPVRLSHAAQHAQEGVAEIGIQNFKRATHLACNKFTIPDETKKNDAEIETLEHSDDDYSSSSTETEETYHTIEEFVDSYGFKSKNKPELVCFLNYRKSIDAANSSHRPLGGDANAEAMKVAKRKKDRKLSEFTFVCKYCNDLNILLLLSIL